MRPVVDRLIKEYAGKVDIRVMHTDRGEPEAIRLSEALGIQYVPTFVFVDSKGGQQGMVVGETPEAALRTRLDALR